MVLEGYDWEMGIRSTVTKEMTTDRACCRPCMMLHEVSLSPFIYRMLPGFLASSQTWRVLRTVQSCRCEDVHKRTL